MVGILIAGSGLFFGMARAGVIAPHSIAFYQTGPQAQAIYQALSLPEEFDLQEGRSYKVGKNVICVRVVRPAHRDHKAAYACTSGLNAQGESESVER